MGFKDYIFEESLITPEMETHFQKRTNEHIARVQKYAKKIESTYPQFKGLTEQASKHDASKLKEPERTPYVFISWQYKKKADGEKYDIPKSINGNEATMHHIKNNSHHPEFHSADETKLDRENRDKAHNCIDASKMPDMDVAEMCADWLGMSEEMGTSVVDWAHKVIDKRWAFSKNQKALIFKILDTVKVGK